MKRVLYIDFENVSTQGLRGVQALSKNDHVKIFLGPKCSKMSLIDADAVFHCDATVELIKNEQIGKNALDFIIMVHMGYDIAKKVGNAFYIISNDKGYDPAIHEMRSMTGSEIVRLSNIAAVLARKVEKSNGFFGIFARNKAEVDNQTEHEVLGKNAKNKSKNNDKYSEKKRNDGKNGGRGERNDRTRKNEERNGKGDRRSGGDRREREERREDRGNRNRRNERYEDRHEKRSDEREKKPNREETVRSVVKRSVAADVDKKAEKTPKNAVRLPEEPKKAIVEKAEEKPTIFLPEEKTVLAADTPEKLKSIEITQGTVTDIAKGKPANDEEIARIVAEAKEKCKTKLEFHNYLMQNMPDKDKVHEIYISEKASINEESTAVELRKTTHTEEKVSAKEVTIEESEEEQRIIREALEECTGKEEFHNYLARRIRDNDRVTALYKAEKKHLPKNK